MVALLLGVLLGFAALVVDVGMMYTEKAKLQNAADAAALAGAQNLPNATTAKKLQKHMLFTMMFNYRMSQLPCHMKFQLK